MLYTIASPHKCCIHVKILRKTLKNARYFTALQKKIVPTKFEFLYISCLSLHSLYEELTMNVDIFSYVNYHNFLNPYPSAPF